MSDRKPNPEAVGRHPVLDALAHLRDELNGLFEEQRSLLLRREADAYGGDVLREALPIEAEPEPTPMHAAAEVVVSLPDPTQPLSASKLVKNRPGLADLAPEDVEAAPPPTAPQPASPPSQGAGGKADDPRQRLDALARLLDKRAKHSTTAPS